MFRSGSLRVSKSGDLCCGEMSSAWGKSLLSSPSGSARQCRCFSYTSKEPLSAPKKCHLLQTVERGTVLAGPHQAPLDPPCWVPQDPRSAQPGAEPPPLRRNRGLTALQRPGSHSGTTPIISGSVSTLASWSHEYPAKSRPPPPFPNHPGGFAGSCLHHITKTHSPFHPRDSTPEMWPGTTYRPISEGFVPSCGRRIPHPARPPLPPSPARGCLCSRTALPGGRSQFGAGAIGKLLTIWMKMVGKLQCLGPFCVAVCVQKLQGKRWKRPAVRNRRPPFCGWWVPPPPHPPPVIMYL